MQPWWRTGWFAAARKGSKAERQSAALRAGRHLTTRREHGAAETAGFPDGTVLASPDRSYAVPG